MKHLIKYLIIIAFFNTILLSQEPPPPVYIQSPPHIYIDPTFTSPPYYVEQVMAVSEIDNDNRLEWVTLYNRKHDNNYEFLRYGNWRKNLNNTNFDGLQTTPYLNETFTTEFNKIRGAVFVKLRNADRKDLVVVREQAIQIYQNQNYSLSLNQNYTSFAGLAVDTGSFNIEDDYQDIVALNNGSVTIYKNNYNGTISSMGWTNNFPNSNTYKKVRARQINNKVYPYSLYLPDNWIDIVSIEYVSNHDEIRIMNNDNNNGFQTALNINPGFAITDFEVEDLTNDGWNDLIVAGTNVLKIYLNVNGTISSTPAYTNTSQISVNPKISIGDFNKDGYNDLCVLFLDQIIKLWINNQSSSLFASAPTEFNTANGTVNGTYSDFEAYDLSNQGGLAVTDIFLTGGSFTIYSGGANRFNAVTWDKDPAPPIIFGDLYIQGGFNRPRLTIYNRGDRDLNSFYQVYRKAPGDPDYLYIGQTEGSNVYIDYTQNVYGGKGVPENGQSVNYKVKAVDLTSHASLLSNNALFWIDGDPPDNMLEGIYANSPDNFFVTNYPNPFNPVTTIYYTIPKPSNVKITIFNALGQVVKELVNRYHADASYNEIQFDGSSLASGMYYYRIEAGDFIETKKMILIK